MSPYWTKAVKRGTVSLTIPVVCLCLIDCAGVSCLQNTTSSSRLNSEMNIAIDLMPNIINPVSIVGSVAQWLECRFLAGRLSLQCTSSMVDR